MRARVEKLDVLGWNKSSNNVVDLFQPKMSLRSHSLLCTKNNHLFIVGIVPILNKELELIFRSDRSDCTCVFTYVSVLHDKLYIYKRNEK